MNPYRVFAICAVLAGMSVLFTGLLGEIALSLLVMSVLGAIVLPFIAVLREKR